MSNLSNSTLVESRSSLTKNSAREGVQKFGRFLSGMVMPNIGAFIAWGLLTALFIDTGWLPNKTLSALVDPIILYLLPLLIGYTAGNNVDGQRGAVTASIATMGVIIASEKPMFIGAMIMGPIAALGMKKFYELIKSKIPTGFEMIINNFASGIIGMIFAIIGYLGVAPLVLQLNDILKVGVETIVNAGLLPFASVLVEPAKILFLNNAINHGVFSPLGLQEAKEVGKSIFFLIETNPGPGLGILLAYMFFGTKNVKATAPGAAIIHFFGGIHEIYFPYVLMNPKLILAAIAGGMSGIFTFSIFDVGLIAVPSPGSIFALSAMTPKGIGNFIGLFAGVLVATVVSFLVASFLLKIKKGSDEDDEDINAAREKLASMKGKDLNPVNVIQKTNVKKIIFACDAGMGSSAMGASTLRNKFKKAGINISVENFAINEIPQDADLVISHKELTSRAKTNAPNAEHLSINEFLGSPLYDKLVQRFSNITGKEISNSDTNSDDENPYITMPSEKTDEQQILKKENILLNQKCTTKEEAVKIAGKVLLESGYIKPEYVNSMLEREKVTTTYIGNGIAIPHGLGKFKNLINKSGIVILQFPEGVVFGEEGEKAYLVIGIAGKGNEHIDILTKIALLAEEEEKVKALFKTKYYKKFYKVFS
jgi:PTS system mannitol-specific IIC component